MRTLLALLFLAFATAVFAAPNNDSTLGVQIAQSEWCGSSTAPFTKTGTFTFDEGGDIVGIVGITDCATAKMAAKQLAGAEISGNGLYSVLITELSQ